MKTEGKELSVYGTMMKILAYINSLQEQKNLAANLAAIRNSIGKSDECATEVWPILFPLIPQEYLGNGSLNYEEKALLTALQLYAVGQQGSNKTSNDEKSKSFGGSLHQIRDKQSTALDRRFNTMLTATTFDEFAYHLRQIFKLGKSKNFFSVNFPELAEDLFWYQKGRDKQICLKWARDYYRPYMPDSNDESFTSEIGNDNDQNKETE